MKTTQMIRCYSCLLFCFDFETPYRKVTNGMFKQKYHRFNILMLQLSLD